MICMLVINCQIFLCLYSANLRFESLYRNVLDYSDQLQVLAMWAFILKLLVLTPCAVSVEKGISGVQCVSSKGDIYLPSRSACFTSLL